MSNHGTPLATKTFKKFSGTVTLNLPELDDELAKDFGSNGEALALILEESLTRDNLEQKLIALGKKEKPVPVEHIVDTDLNPKAPSGFSLTGKGTEHRKMGKMKLELRNGKLYANGIEVIRELSPNQRKGKVIQGHKLREELKGKQVLNACIRDYLFEHPELIPESWKQGVTYFWGTIFRSSSGHLCVACLGWSGDGWNWYYNWLDCDWDDSEPAAVLADQPSVDQVLEPVQAL